MKKCRSINNSLRARSIRKTYQPAFFHLLMMRPVLIVLPQPLCTAIWKHRKLCQVMNHATCPEGVAEWFPKRRRWKEADLAVDKLLAVTLMNECPTEWKYNDNMINHKLFMELVNDAWRNKFILGAQDASHIHVLFKGMGARIIIERQISLAEHLYSWMKWLRQQVLRSPSYSGS